MKFFIALVLLTSFSIFGAENSKENPNSATEKSLSDAKSVRKAAYKKAKEACLADNKELKGKALKECIVKKQIEAK